MIKEISNKSDKVDGEAKLPKEINNTNKIGKLPHEISSSKSEMHLPKEVNNEPKHIKTINENLVNETYPGTDVEYCRKKLNINGEKVEGVFPVFESKCDVILPKKMREASDTEQFKYCVEKLKQRIESNPGFAERFTNRQLEQIKSGAPRISGLTWHHNESPGRMQLVDANIHSTCRHTGGRSIWGGGAEYR